jgi:hypothetical protein
VREGEVLEQEEEERRMMRRRRRRKYVSSIYLIGEGSP